MYKLLLLIITIYVSSLSAQHRTPDYYKCSNRIGGSWIFGKAPYACDSSAFGDDLFAFQNYSDFIFSDQRLSSEERIAYMSRMHKAIQKVLSWYLLERNPEVSASEQALWQQAIFAKLHQESFWSHYRLSDQNILKHMRGDFGHGHGIGQIDDRWHFVQIDNGVGWDLFENLVYGLDVFYREWQRAAKARCVSSPISVDRVRAAYSAYNGGPSQICRWVNPDHRWARNDKNFYQKFQARQWERYIQNDYSISVDPICLVKKERGCRVDNGKTTFEEGDLLKIDNSKICVVKNENLECLENTEDLACMSALDSKVSDSAMEVSFEEIKEYKMKIFDRYKICKAAQPALTNIGGFILLKKSINLRKTPGGGYLTVALKDSIVEVLDFYINIPLTKNFYYKIKYNQKIGYIYAGDLKTANEWTQEAQRPNDKNHRLAQKGELIKIVLDYGINMRATPAGKYMTVVPHKTWLKVIDRKIIGDRQKVYYRVRHRDRIGWIFAGAMKPIDYLDYWTKKL